MWEKWLVLNLFAFYLIYALGQPNLEKTDKSHVKKHILMFHPWGTPSHLLQFKPLIHGLLDAGNAVTAVFVTKTKINHQDYTEIIVEDG